MSEQQRQTWFYREDGHVVQATLDVVDPTPLLRANAYVKAARGEELTDGERAIVEAVAGQPLAGTTPGNLVGEMALGFMFLQHPELVREVDELATKWAAKLGPFIGEYLGWTTLQTYVERAAQNVLAEAGIGVTEEEQAKRLAPDDPERQAELRAGWEAQRLESDAWSETPEGKAAAALTSTPDDGPEGWSTVPPSDPNNSNHPDRLAEQMARHWRLVNADRASRGEPPHPQTPAEFREP